MRLWAIAGEPEIQVEIAIKESIDREETFILSPSADEREDIVRVLDKISNVKSNNYYIGRSWSIELL